MINERYKIVKLSGEGRSKVYLCEDVEFPGKEFALKCLPAGAEQEEIENFRNEFFTLRKLDHPNIIKAYEIGTIVKRDVDDEVELGSKFITLEYFQASELKQSELIKDESTLKEIIRQLCAVLYYLHQANFIYYDLKPENILISREHQNLKLKLIDLGFASFIPEQNSQQIKGSVQYIAPELLKKEPHDYRVDFYSLGMILYLIIYNRFPFETDEEIEIYKAQIEKNFNFPSSENYSDEIINVTKKLLAKNPGERYKNEFQILNDLNIALNSNDFKEFIPARIFSDRKDIINILTNYIRDKDSSEVFDIKGFDGAGKSTIITRIFEQNENSIIIENTQGKSHFNLLKFIYKKIIFSREIYPLLNNDEKKLVSSLLSSSPKEFLETIHPVISSVTANKSILLLIEDFNSFDNFTIEVLTDLIPVFQVNDIKMILTESSDLDFKSERINNLRDLTVGSFTSAQLSEYIELAFYSEFPKQKLINHILTYADLLPGNIVGFIKDLIQLELLKFVPDGAVINENKDDLSVLEGSFEKIYNLRLAQLDEKSLYLAKIISSFEGSIERNVLKELSGSDVNEFSKLLSNLQYHNIILPATINPAPVISSEGLKNHIYSLIENTNQFHSKIAGIISEKIPGFNKNELARQYELAGEYKDSYKVLTEELDNAEKLSAFSYMRGILEHLLSLPLDNTLMNKIRYRLILVRSRMSDYSSTLDMINEIDESLLTKEQLLETLIIKGSSLISSGKAEEGKDVLKNLIHAVQNEFRKNKLLVEIAYAKFEMNNYSEANELAHEILSKNKVDEEDVGRIYNLLGMMEIFQNNSPNNALEHFEKALLNYKKANLMRRAAGMEVNIGNIYNMLGDDEKTEDHWTKALKINLSIGNLEQEGKLLLNNGIYYFLRNEVDTALESYKRASKIFLSLGDKNSYGVLLGNLGELYFVMCDYEESYYSLQEGMRIFYKSKNVEELAPIVILLSLWQYTVGTRDLLLELYNSFENILLSEELKDNFELELEFIKQLILILNDEPVDLNILKAIMNKYLDQGQVRNYLIVKSILLEYLLHLTLYEEVLNELNDKDFKNICSEKKKFQAQREYFLGKISLNFGSEKLDSPIVHFEKAYEILLNDNVTEFTWKVLLELADIYTARGQVKKAKKMIIYGSELLKLIAEKIETPKFKKAYLERADRKEALERLDKLIIKVGV